MDFKEFIEKPRVLTEKICLLETQLETLRSSSKFASSRPSQTPKGNSRYASALEEYVTRIDGIEKLISQLRETRDAIGLEISLLFSELDNILQMRVLSMRYLDFKTFPEIMATLGYGKQYVFRLHKEGLEAVEKIYLKKREQQ